MLKSKFSYLSVCLLSFISVQSWALETCEEAIKNPNSSVVVSYFTADWCAPCSRNQKIFSEIKELYKNHEKVKVCDPVDIDADTNSKFASSQGITAIPTLIIYKNGKQAFRKIGERKIDMTTISSEIEEALK